MTGVPFVDVRPNIGATCTLVTRYLTEQQVSIPEKVATALLYGIETEVTGYPREASIEDDDALLQLYPLADKDLLAQIRNARLPHSHFECLLQALQSSFIYDRLIISWVNPLPQPEQAAEVVDFVIRFEEVDWAVCGGVFEDQLILSVRSALPDAKSGEVLRKVVGDLGRAGGHDRRAGGAIPLTSTSPSAIEDLQSELRRRFLKVLKIEDIRGSAAGAAAGDASEPANLTGRHVLRPPAARRLVAAGLGLLLGPLPAGQSRPRRLRWSSP